MDELDRKIIAALRNDARTSISSLSKSLDVAVQKGVLHKNSAANKKSSMAKAAAKAGAR